MPSSARPSILAVIQALAGVGLIAVGLFVAAGRLDITAFWWYLAIAATASAFALFLIDPDLAGERMHPGGRPLPRPCLFLALLPSAHWISAGLDRGRLHWSDTVAPLLQVIGLALFALALAAIVWAMHVNRFFSSVARIQRERGHYVVTDGPYRWIRHPGYAAAALATLASGLALGSWLATAIGALGVPLLLWRTIVEDRLLRAELPGYREYASRVRYKLILGLW